jgi:hypothetical protein
LISSPSHTLLWKLKCETPLKSKNGEEKKRPTFVHHLLITEQNEEAKRFWTFKSWTQIPVPGKGRWRLFDVRLKEDALFFPSNGFEFIERMVIRIDFLIKGAENEEFLQSFQLLIRPMPMFHKEWVSLYKMTIFCQDKILGDKILGISTLEL